MALENVFKGIAQAIRELEVAVQKLEAEAAGLNQLASKEVRRTDLHPSSSVTPVSPGLVAPDDDTVIAELLD